MIRHRFASVFVIAMLVVMSSRVGAQSAESNRAGVQRANLISTNPIGVIFEWYNGEFEHAFNSTASIAVAGSHFDFGDEDATSVDAILRYYPSARAVRGFSVGGSLGYTNVNENNCFECTDADFSAFAVGVRADYVWILGRDQHFAAAAGIGAKRLFSDSDNGLEALPIGRLSIGYAW